MRKLSMSMMLCIIMVSSAFLASCSKDETSDSSNPITELTFPASDAGSPIYTGDLVQIGGKGFATDCEIWLQGADGKEVKAAITVNSDGVSFQNNPGVEYETYAYSQENLINFSEGWEADGKRRVYNLTYTGNQVKVLAVYEDGGTEEYLYNLNAQGYAI